MSYFDHMNQVKRGPAAPEPPSGAVYRSAPDPGPLLRAGNRGNLIGVLALKVWRLATVPLFGYLSR